MAVTIAVVPANTADVFRHRRGRPGASLQRRRQRRGQGSGATVLLPERVVETHDRQHSGNMMSTRHDAPVRVPMTVADEVLAVPAVYALMSGHNFARSQLLADPPHHLALRSRVRQCGLQSPRKPSQLIPSWLVPTENGGKPIATQCYLFEQPSTGK